MENRDGDAPTHGRGSAFEALPRKGRRNRSCAGRAARLHDRASRPSRTLEGPWAQNINCVGCDAAAREAAGGGRIEYEPQEVDLESDLRAHRGNRVRQGALTRPRAPAREHVPARKGRQAASRVQPLEVGGRERHRFAAASRPCATRDARASAPMRPARAPVASAWSSRRRRSVRPAARGSLAGASSPAS